MAFALKYLKSNVFSFFDSFSTSKCSILFEIILLLISHNLVSKSVVGTKSACASLAVKTLAAKLLNSGVVMYFS